MENLNINSIIENLYEGAYIVDPKRKIIAWNKSAENITGYKASEVVNSFCYHNILRHVDGEGTELCIGGCPLADTIKTGNINDCSVFLHHKLGHRVPVSIRSIPLFDESKKITSVLEIFTDTRFAEENYHSAIEISKIADIDPLTTLFNRRYIEFQLENAASEYHRFKKNFGVLFIDIDDFKKVNDTYGHSVGDEILKTIAKTISGNIQATDYVGRWGGEEFIVVLRGVNLLKDLLKISERIRILSKNSSYLHEGKEIGVTISIGGSLFNGDEKTNSLIDRADKLMYQAKQTGKNKSIIK